MSTIQLTHDTVRIRLTRGEKIAGLLRDVDLPRAEVRSATVAEDGVRAARGLRAPGLALPGRKIGTWRRRGTRTLVAVRRGEPALHLVLDGSGTWSEVLVGTAQAATLARELSGAPARS